jgi:hypothetical protein
MADFRDCRNGTDGDQGVNERRSADHMLSTSMTWQPIETAPKDWETPVLTYRKAGFISVAAWINDKHGWCCTDGVGLLNVTHWMPLPAPPAHCGHIPGHNGGR